MKGMLIPTDGTPRTIDIQQDENGSALHDLQRLVDGYIEPFDVIFGENICLYVNEEGLGNCPPNRAVYATRNMVEEGYLSQMDYTSVVQEGELYTILWGDIVAVGFDPETGMDRDLTDAEIAQVGDYFTKVSAPGSGLAEALAIQQGRRREEPVQEHGVSLKDEADASRDASDALGGGSAPDDPQHGMEGR